MTMGLLPLTAAVLIGISVVATSAAAQQSMGEDANVISYYAVGNSLDGQLLVDRVNVLRFYPVYRFRKHITAVNVSAHYGSRIFSRAADSLGERSYWQVQLPRLELGEAIQRLEVEVTLDLKSLYQRSVSSHVAMHTVLQTQVDALNADIAALRTSVRATRDFAIADNERIDAATASFQENIELFQSNLHALSDSLAGVQRLVARQIPMTDSDSLPTLLSTCNDLREHLKQLTATVDSSRQLLSSSVVNVAALSSYLTAFQNISQRVAVLDTLPNATRAIASEVFTFAVTATEADDIRALLLDDIESDLGDPDLSGPSVLRSDITLTYSTDEPGFPIGARILYRNYKPALRRMPALDPAEKLGLFRARYVPLAIVGRKLRSPNNTSVVFEVGLAFGDAIIAGDDFVVPELSFRRLSAVFAVTPELFNDNASVRALALTYDFNSYGSLGLGVNFPITGSEPYVSFGINKKAFEDVMGSLQSLFTQ